MALVSWAHANGRAGMSARRAVRRFVTLAAVALLVSGVAAAPGMGSAKGKAPVGVWSGPGFEWDNYGYTILTIANGPAEHQRLFIAMEDVGICGEGTGQGRPGVFVGTASYSGGELASLGGFVCSDDNSLPDPQDINIVLEYDAANDRWRWLGFDGSSGWFLRRCIGNQDATPASGVPNVVVGNKGDNNLYGTAGHDVLDGRGGNDLLVGRGGMDILCGGNGRDVLKGKAGIDVMVGGGGNDKLVGGFGVDVGLGGAGKDRLLGGAGTDFLLGEGKNDVIKGQAGPNDLADGGFGSDLCVAEVQDNCER